MNLLTLLLQTTDTLVTPPVLTPTVETAGDLNLWELACKGGIIMIPLLLLSLLSIYIFFERLQVIRRAAREDNTFMERIKDYIHEGDIDSALKLCKKTNTPYSRLIAKGISRLGRPMNDVLVAIENVGNIEIAKLEKGFPWLATTAAGAPMLGFLGTVTGMVRAFYNMASAGNNADISTLSGGFPIVLHGSSSVPQEYVDIINQYGGKLPDAVGIPEEQLREATKALSARSTSTLTPVSP